ncbi:hypothetical protein D9758_007407 [Tetrapyrgos nigripes]|uniref:Uncharacterized protein n=1 Tax=Tetrapyrgos nigripes TaxID=182062 RepID=A0A8H5G3L4_9AGAR|nr:hypothetical protein D9758_007407 [Tetrapyrgos nigripes]
MGGFVTRQGHHPIILPSQLTEEILLDIKATKVQDIKDKSKGDAVSKGVTLLQTSWFLVQILTRAIQHLPIAALEISTVAFAVLNLLVYGLWWYKPLDVQRSIMIGPGPEEIEISATSYRQWFSPARILKFLKFVVFGGSNYYPEKSISVPIIWAGYPEESISVIWAGYSYQFEGAGFMMTSVVASIVACLFGAIHCVAWNFSFPTSTEQTMWRISAAFVALFPSLFSPGLATRCIQDGLYWESLLKRFRFLRYIELFPQWIYIAIIVTGLPLYVVCRLVLLTITFTTLRSLPADAYRDIDWTRYLPHM